MFIEPTVKGFNMTEQMMTAKDVCARFGGVTTMSLYRWLKDEALGFPQPIQIRKRRYWLMTDIATFQNRMASEGIRRRSA
ncbi:MAG: hypothetical protein EON54_06545 [Alcaligenaceae bacterium]|nr:MAG: hypothetical protein EON54_06545 [Alcaligenaceae bacterium]